MGTLRLSIPNKKPDIIVLTKARVEDEAFDGKKKFRGYKLSQHSTNGRQGGGLMVFTRRNYLPMQGTIRNFT
jgi:hypothetical protein